MTNNDILKAASTLAKSERGTRCLKALHKFLDESAWSLDSQNQHSVKTLVAAFFDQPHNTLDYISDVIEP